MSSEMSANNLRLRSVLAATDFSEASKAPLDHALATARHYKAKFYLVTVVSHEDNHVSSTETTSKAVARARSQLIQLEANLVATGALEGLECQTLVLPPRAGSAPAITIRALGLDKFALSNPTVS